MKKTKFYLLIFSFLILFLMTSVQQKALSQITDCGDCPDVLWSQPITTTVYIAVDSLTNAPVTVTYQTRNCNGYELNILSMTYDSTLKIDNPQMINNIVVAAMLWGNPMLFPPFNPNSSAYWNIIQKACWKFSDQTNLGIIPCNSDCCKSRFFVVRGDSTCPPINRFVGIKDVGLYDCYDPQHLNNNCWYVCNFQNLQAILEEYYKMILFKN